MISGSEFANVARANLAGRILGEASVHGNLVAATHGATVTDHGKFVVEIERDVRTHGESSDIELLGAMCTAITAGAKVALDA